MSRAIKTPHRQAGHEFVGGVTGLLLVLSLGLGAWALAGPPRPAMTDQAPPRTRLQVAVHQGLLSVDVHAADLRAVLAQIGQQAGIAIVLSETAATVVSAQFAGRALDDGLRQLLQRAAVNYLLVYGPDATGAAVVREVRVFGAVGAREAPAAGPAAPPDPTLAGAQDPSAAEPPGAPVASPFRPLVERLEAAPRPPRPRWSAPEAVARLRNLFQSPLGGEAGRPAQEGPAAADEATR